jgi:septum formation protein
MLDGFSGYQLRKQSDYEELEALRFNLFLLSITNEFAPPAKMTEQHKKGDFILASASPRRRKLLAQLGLSFIVVPSKLQEINQIGIKPHVQATYFAEAKAKEVADRHPDKWVLGADTIVILGQEILGKPADFNEASSMLSRLGGRSHCVITGICLVNASLEVVESEWVETKVFMRSLTVEDIEGYIRTGEPMDKAGAYGIQGIGGCLVQRIEGSYSNVVGLPLCETLELLRRHGVANPFK